MTQADNLAALGSYVSTSGVLQQTGGGNQTTTGYYGFKNRIINGAMVIDQRNAGAEVNPAVSGSYYLDRWIVASSVGSKFKIGQNAGSVTPPTGFKNYLGCTSLSAYTPLTNEQFTIQQRIEGYNVADLDWGTANAKTVTLSFWVYSSLTGTFGGNLRNSPANRYYPYSYTINSANTWEYKTITVIGDTTGTWATDNTTGLNVHWSLGAGPTVSGTAGAWTSTATISVTGATSVVGTNGATFYITGVQLEVGSTATSFDYRPYGTELALCQRYYAKSYNTSVVPGTASSFDGSVAIASVGTVSGSATTAFGFPVEMRASPTMTFYSGNSGTSGVWRDSGSGTDKAVAIYVAAGTRGGSVYNVGTMNGASSVLFGHWVASIEL